MPRPSAPSETLDIPPSVSAKEVPPSPTFSLDDTSGEDEDDADADTKVAAGNESTRGVKKPDSLELPPNVNLLKVPESNSPSVRSPMESESRAMLAEESEVFRRGLALGVDDVPDEDDEGDRERNAVEDDGQLKKKSEVSGEELKKEVSLEASRGRSSSEASY